MSTDATLGAAKFADAVDHLWLRLKALAGEGFAPALEQLAKWIDLMRHVGQQGSGTLGQMIPGVSTQLGLSAMSGAAGLDLSQVGQTTLGGLNAMLDPKAVANLQAMTNPLKGLHDALIPLTPSQQAFLEQLRAMGTEFLRSDAILGTGITVQQLEHFKKVSLESAEAAKKIAAAMQEMSSVGEGWRGTLETIDGETVDAIKYYLEAGVAQGKLATAYALTEPQVRAVESALQNEKQELKETFEQIHFFREETIKAAEAIGKGLGLQPVLMNLAAAMGDVQLGSKQLDEEVLGVMPDLSRNAAQRMYELRDGVYAWGVVTRQILGDIPQLVASAFTGGGGPAGAREPVSPPLGPHPSGEGGRPGVGARG